MVNIFTIINLNIIIIIWLKEEDFSHVEDVAKWINFAIWTKNETRGGRKTKKLTLIGRLLKTTSGYMNIYC